MNLAFRSRKNNSFAFLFSLGLLVVSVTTTPVRAQGQGQKQWLVARSASSDSHDARKRVALVMSCANYRYGPPLQNTPNDATDMTQLLTDCGFDVLTVKEADKQTMISAITEFGRRLGPDTVALFYYSGHGIQIGGKNYLLPIDFNAESETQASFDGVEADRVLGEMGSRGSALNVVILDACRNNPFEKSWSGRGEGGPAGLAPMSPPKGTLLAYATAPGTRASDNVGGRNGLYTQELLKCMREPGLGLQEVFSRTAVSVADLSGDKQEPWVQAGPLRGSFRFIADATGTGGNEVVINPGVAIDTKARLLVSVIASEGGGTVSGAVVAVDGTPTPGGTFALNLLDEQEKSVTVKVTAPGYDGQLIPVTLLRGRTVKMPVKLARLYVPPPMPNPKPEPVSPPVQPGQFTPPLTLAQYKAQMVTIPAGEFTMGSKNGELNEKPAHKVMLSSYKIGKTEVTVGMWEEFCKAKGKSMPDSPFFNAGWIKKNHPIVNVSWNDAQEYCAWAGLKLPSEAQWEKAARGTDGRQYPWGKDWDGSKCVSRNTDPTGAVRNEVLSTAPVGSKPSGASPYGVLDLSGNVREWCLDTYESGFYKTGNARIVNPANTSVGVDRVVRGGSWLDFAEDLRCANRAKDAPTPRFDRNGFRAVSP